MDSAMLPSLRIGNTLTSKTIKFGRKETALKGGGIDPGINNGVLCTSPAIQG